MRVEPWRMLRTAAGWAPAVGAGCLLALAVLFLIHHYVRSTEPVACGCFDSDSLYVPALCRDWLGATWGMTGTHLPGAPYIFPDALLMLPCVAATSDLAIAFLLYALLFYGLLGLAAGSVARQTGLGWRESLCLGWGGTALLLAAHLGPAYHVRALGLGYPGNHVGAILIGLSLAALALRSLHRPLGPGAAALFVLAGGLGAFSDKLLVVQFLLPLGLTFAVLAGVRVVRPRQVLTLAGCGAGAAAVFFATQALFRRMGFVLLGVEDYFSLARSLESCQLLVKLSPVVLQAQYLAVALMLVAVATALAVLALWSRRAWAGRNAGLTALEDLCTGGPSAESAERSRAAVLALALFLLLSGLCSLTAVVALGLWHEASHVRYVLPLLYLPFLFAAVLLRLVPWAGVRFARAAAVALLAGFILLRTGGEAPTFAWDHLRQPYPELAQAFDRLARERGVHFALAGFWYARHTSLLTREHVRVKTMNAMGPWTHADDPCDYLSPEVTGLALPRYQAMLFDNSQGCAPNNDEPDKDQVVLEFGKPAERRFVGPYEIWLYDRLDSPRFRRFLTGLLAAKIRRCWQFDGPARPATLARPKANFTPWNAHGNQRIKTGEELEAAFARPLTGATIDLAADWSTEYELTFCRGQEHVGSVRVPAVPWTGAAYERPGAPSVFARLVSLPDVLRHEPWNRVLIRPARGGGNRHGVAHLLVYQNSLDLGPPASHPFTRHRFEAEAMYTPLDPESSLGTDPYASGGQVRQAPAGRATVVAFWPSLALDPGRYRADYAVRLAAVVPPGKKVGRLVVTACGGTRQIGYRELYGKDFHDGGGYQVLPLDFVADADPTDLVFRIDTYGAAPLAVDYVDLTALPPGGPPDRAEEERQ